MSYKRKYFDKYYSMEFYLLFYSNLRNFYHLKSMQVVCIQNSLLNARSNCDLYFGNLNLNTFLSKHVYSYTFSQV
ncbi:hypothetical protein T08_995 [Trichinella sp. T8]|nr:hypothetical protein T08_995 [Trichinella sp. T8]